MDGVGLVKGTRRQRASAFRYLAPVVFLLGVTVAVLLIRSGLSEGNDVAAPPAATTTGGTATRAGTTRTTTTTPRAARPRFYEIQRGDTLETVAAEFETTVEQLLVLNPDVDPVALGIGERIRVR